MSRSRCCSEESGRGGEESENKNGEESDGFRIKVLEDRWLFRNMSVGGVVS